MIEDNPRVPKPEPAKPATVRDEDLIKEGTVQIVGGDTPARKACHDAVPCLILSMCLAVVTRVRHSFWSTQQLTQQLHRSAC